MITNLSAATIWYTPQDGLTIHQRDNHAISASIFRSMIGPSPDFLMKQTIGEQRCGKHAHKKRRVVALIKRITRRARRRVERADPENAPTQNRYRGWDD